jgi:hypothetical protein
MPGPTGPMVAPAGGPVAPPTPPPAPGPPPAAPTPPEAPTPPSRAAFFGGQPEPTTGQPAAPAQPPAQDFDFEGFTKAEIAKLLPDSLIAGATGDQVKHFQQVKDALSKAVAERNSAVMKLTRAHAGAGTVAEQALKEKLAAAEARLTEVSPKIESLSKLEARAELLDNDAFAGTYTDGIKALRTEALEIAKEAGVEPEVIDKAFAAESKMGLLKVLKDVEDEDAKSLIGDIAKKGLELTTKFKSEWKDPLRAIEEWREKQAKNGVMRSVANSEEAITRHRAAVAEVAKNNFAVAIMLQRPETAAALAEIEQQYATNAPIPKGQMFEDRVNAASVPHLINYAVSLEADLESARAEIAQLRGMQPSGYAQPGQQQIPGAPQVPGAGVGKAWGFPAPVTGPVIPGAVLPQATRV